MALWPNSRFAVPVSSFPEPVPVPGVDPMSGDCSIIRVNKAWIPYIAGCLQQLLLQTTWATDADGLNTVQMQASTLILALENLESGDCGGSIQPAIAESDYQMSICEQLRFQNGKLQGLCCGEWVDIEGQSSQGSVVGGQPGEGSPVPHPNGGTQQYCGAMSNGSKWLLPVPVSSGDTLLFNSLAGAWNDSREIIWNCPDGWVYALGSCGQTLPHGSPDPLTTALHMQIVALIDGNYYDVLLTSIDGSPTQFTVPGGISNAIVELQANIDDLSMVDGEVTFCVNVTNNQSGEWSHTIDYTTSPHGISRAVGLAPIGHWVPGVGLVNDDGQSGSGAWYRGVAMNINTITPFNLTSVDIFYNLTMGAYNLGSSDGLSVDALVGSGAVGEIAILHGSLIDGTGLSHTGSTASPGTTGYQIILVTDDDASSPSGFLGSCAVTTLVIHGTGPEPVWP